MPLLSKQEIRRYREEANLYSEHRARGTHPYTLDEVDARITACAADLAATKGEGPVSPPILSELVALFWHRLYRDVPLDAEQRASFELDSRKAATEANIAKENQTRAERRRRDLESDRKRTRPPLTGTILTSPWAILFCLIPGAVIEVLGATPSLKIAFEIPTIVAGLFAFAISAILILAADQLGNALASGVSSSRRLTGAVAGFLLAVAVAAAVWSVVELADSRSTNMARQDQLEAIESTGGTSAGFSGFDELLGGDSAAADPEARAAEAKERAAAAAAREAAIEKLPPPSFSFFVPLSVMIMATAMLVAFRIEGAREWHESSGGIADARQRAMEQRKREEEARKAANEAGVPEDQVLQEAATYVEREHGVLSGWVDRFRAEYQRFCAAEQCEPRSIVAPRLPQPEEALERLLHPRGRPPGAGPAQGQRRRPGRHESDGPDEPADARSARAEAAQEGSAQAPSPGGGPTTRVREEPPLGAQRPRQPRRPRRRDGDGRATGWGSPGQDGR